MPFGGGNDPAFGVVPKLTGAVDPRSLGGGFPIYDPVPKTAVNPAYADQNDRAVQRGNVSTTGSSEDWIAQLVTNLVPSRPAAAEETAPAPVQPARGAMARINATPPAGYVRPPMAPWYERMGLVPSSTPPAFTPSIIGDRG